MSASVKADVGSSVLLDGAIETGAERNYASYESNCSFRKSLCFGPDIELPDLILNAALDWHAEVSIGGQVTVYKSLSDVNIPASRWIPWILAAAVVFCGLLYVWGTHSAGYAFLDQAVRKSSNIQRRVGDVQPVGLGGYDDKTDGSKEWVTMTLRVTGSKGAVTLRAVAEKVNNVWSVRVASIGGEHIILN